MKVLKVSITFAVPQSVIRQATDELLDSLMELPYVESISTKDITEECRELLRSR